MGETTWADGIVVEGDLQNSKWSEWRENTAHGKVVVPETCAVWEESTMSSGSHTAARRQGWSQRITQGDCEDSGLIRVQQLQKDLDLTQE